MARRYADPVEVQRRDEDPAQFLWRGRIYLVRAVLAHWMERDAWWRAPRAWAVLGADRPPAGAPGVGHDREVWRVEAAAGRSAALGVYDLCFDWQAGNWAVCRAHD